MMHETEYRLSAGEASRILRLVGQLKEALGELLVNRHTIVPHDAFDDNTTPTELHFFAQAENILVNGEF